MGFTEFMERRAQQELLKRAMEAGWTASTCIGMVAGPLWAILEMGQPTRAQVDAVLSDWLRSWQSVRRLSDRNLYRNRPYYLIHPNRRLSPLLARFEEQLSLNLADRQSDVSTIVARVKDAYMKVVFELLEFNRWAKEEAGPLTGFDAARYDDTAVRRAQRYWEPTVRELKKAL